MIPNNFLCHKHLFLLIMMVLYGHVKTTGQCNNFQNSITVPVSGTTYNCNNPSPPATDMVCADFNVVFSNGNASFYWGWTITTGASSVTTTNGPVNSSQQSQYPNIVCVNVPCNSSIVFFVNAYSNPNGGGTLCSQASATVSTSPFSPLPIVIKSLELKQVNHNFRIDWTTASEINNDYFVIEGSNDGIEWLELDKVKGQGNSSIEHDYYWYIGKHHFFNYFRLKQVDYDGQFSFSDIVVYKRQHDESITIFNNSHTNELHLIAAPESGNMDYIVYDATGKIVPIQLLNLMEDEVILSTSSLKQGLYFIYVSQGGVTKAHRFFKE